MIPLTFYEIEDAATKLQDAFPKATVLQIARMIQALDNSRHDEIYYVNRIVVYG